MVSSQLTLSARITRESPLGELATPAISQKCRFSHFYKERYYHMSNRREFLRACAASSTLLATSSLAQTNTEQVEKRIQHPLAIFAKPLQHLSFDELARRLQSIGVQGIEATLRSGGQVEPKDFDRDLGRLTEALGKHEQQVVIAASDINDTSPASEKQLRQFAGHGIRFIRMSYYRYEFDKPILPQLESFAKQATELAALCQTLGLTALYQNHAGKNYVGAALWDLQRVLQAVNPRHLAVALDIRHTAVELSQSWPAAYSAIRPHIGAIYVKDISWVNNKPVNVPLGEGIAQPVFEQVRRDGLIGPLSLHVEYIDHRPSELQEQRWAAVQSDVLQLRRWLT